LAPSPEPSRSGARILPLKPRVKNTHSVVSSNSGSASITVPFNVGYDLDFAAQDAQNRAQNALAPLPSEVVQQSVSVTNQSTAFTLAANVISPDGRYDDAFLSNYADLHISDVLRRMYVNDFNKFGRIYRGFLQATEDFRSSPEDISHLYVRISAGDMVPLGALIQVRPVVSPQTISHYSLYRSAEINGSAPKRLATGSLLCYSGVEPFGLADTAWALARLANECRASADNQEEGSRDLGRLDVEQLVQPLHLCGDTDVDV